MNKELRGFVDPDGRLTAYPAKKKKKLMALAYLAEKIPEGERFAEQDFNELLNHWHSFRDPATLRRELYNAGLINRSKDGKEYCLNPQRPSEEELLRELESGKRTNE